MNLQDSGAKGADIVYGLIVTAVDAVEAKSEAHHFEVTVGEMLDGCAVADMPQDGMREGFLKLLAALEEQFVLHCRERVEVIGIAAHEVRKDGARDEGRLPL